MPKQRYRIRNWSKYNTSLVKRGSLSCWFDEQTLKQWSEVERSERRGRPKCYADTGIECLLVVKAVFGLDFRKLEGFARSVMQLKGIALRIPSYSQICRRQKTLLVSLKALPRSGRIHVVVDSTGLKVFGEGEWKVRQHGYSKRRTWRKLHLGVEPSSGEIMASCLSTNDLSDGELLPDLMDQIGDTIESVSADGAYDRLGCYEAIDKRGIQANIPPRKDAVIKQHGNCKGPPLTRDENMRAIRQMGRAAWKISVGYHRRSLAETAMFRFKTLFGNRLVNRCFEHQPTEAFIKCQAMNKMTQLGMPDSVPI